MVVAASVAAGAHARNAAGCWVGAGRAISCCALSFAATAASAAYGRGRAGLRPLLASTSLAALPIGVGSPAAFAQCAIQPTANVQGSVTNTSPSTSPINCISISGITVTNNITNPSTAVIISETSFGPPTRTGITISNSSIGGAIVNAGQVTSVNGAGIFITNNATVSSGISNADTISAGGKGIDVFFASTFAGGISNSGTISAAPTGIFVFE